MSPHAVEELMARAEDSMGRAIAPYSGFRVGAALLGTDGRIFTGANIENPSLMLTMCAERIAIYKALTEGTTRFNAIAVVCSEDRLCTPCGPCRQILFEFAPGVPVYLKSSAGIKKFMVEDFLPFPFIK